MYRSKWFHNLIKAIWPETSASFVDFYNNMFEQWQMTINGFHGAGITKAVNEAKTFLNSVESLVLFRKTVLIYSNVLIDLSNNFSFS